MFIVGFFPLAALQALQHVASRALSLALPSLTSDYPLDQLDGFNVWYEARLAEEGVEDMQNLTTMNLVDVILHTRVPPGRLVDWADQAFLLTHLEDAAGAGPDADTGGAGDAVGGEAARRRLRRVGIRTATGLLKAFSVPSAAPAGGGAPERVFALPEGVDPAASRGSAAAAGEGPGAGAGPEPGVELAAQRGPGPPGLNLAAGPYGRRAATIMRL